MTKVAIVGVEGSGKTVLMAALGDKYKYSDEQGLSLKPKNRETLAFVMSAMGELRQGVWPEATVPDDIRHIRWAIQRRANENVDSKSVGELAFLDFAGEAYRAAFGDRKEPVPKELATAVSELRKHVMRADRLVVLVNLGEIINARQTDPLAIEMVWLTQNIIEFAREKGVDKIAIGLSQADRYRDVLDECGGSKGVLAQYLPNVASSYSSLDVFELSAVTQTVPNEQGKRMPAADFGSEGLDRLMAWIAQPSARAKRRRIVKWVVGIAVVVAVAFGANLVREEVRKQNERSQAERERWEKTRLDEEKARIRQEELAAEQARLKRERDLAEEERLRQERIRREDAANDEKIARGWSAQERGGRRVAVWTPGAYHPQSKRLRAKEKPDDWEAVEEGYEWVGGTNLRWRVGVKLKGFPHWVTSETETYARPEAGYKKKDESASGWCELVWAPGMIDGSKGEKRRASSVEGRWLDQVDCDVCDGTGRRARQVECPRCKGDGTVQGSTRCVACGGGGKTETQGLCSECRGMRMQQVPCNAGCQPIIIGFMNTRGFRCPCGGGGVCMHCFGTGIQVCKTCGGNGQRGIPCRNCSGMGFASQQIDCYFCKGRGRVHEAETCPKCSGRREISENVACTNCGRDGCRDGKVWDQE